MTWGARALGGCEIHFQGAQEKPNFHFIVTVYLQFKVPAIKILDLVSCTYFKKYLEDSCSKV